MATLLQANQIDPATLTMDEEERARMEASAAQPDPKVEVEQIRSQTLLQIAQLKNDFANLSLQISSQDKAAAREHGADIANTQLAGQIAATAMKNQGKAEGEKPKEISQSENPPTPPTSTSPELSLDEAMNILGL